MSRLAKAPLETESESYKSGGLGSIKAEDWEVKSFDKTLSIAKDQALQPSSLEALEGKPSDALRRHEQTAVRSVCGRL